MPPLCMSIIDKNKTVNGFGLTFTTYHHKKPDGAHGRTLPNMIQKKQLTLIIVMGIILGVNTFIFLIFSFILKRITWSLSKITESAKQLSKGRRTAPLTVHSNDELGLLAQSFNHMLNNVQTNSRTDLRAQSLKNDLAQLPEGIIVTDLNNKLLSANRAAEMMLGFSIVPGAKSLFHI